MRTKPKRLATHIAVLRSSGTSPPDGQDPGPTVPQTCTTPATHPPPGTDSCFPAKPTQQSPINVCAHLNLRMAVQGQLNSPPERRNHGWPDGDVGAPIPTAVKHI
ncbi:hypothetical protein Vretimale_18054 [Volvox reticuliferus]|nr:hypothetical protein Vretimale_18054 [Volvox reticuliferus]